MSGIVNKNLGRDSGVVKATPVGADTVSGANITDDAIDSEHYVDGSIDNAHIADDAIDSEHYAAGSIDEAHIADNAVTLAKMASGTDGNIISFDASGNPVAIATGNDGQVLTSTGAGSPPAFEDAAGGGKVQQIVYTEDHADAESSTTLPWDDTIPQNAEGFEVMTRAITPTSSSSILIISAIVNTSNSAATIDEGVTCALFQDSTANAIAATATGTDNNYYSVGMPLMLSLTHHMVAGTTSSTTFKIRLGGHSGTTYFNKSHEGDKFGGMYCSSITITEYTP